VEAATFAAEVQLLDLEVQKLEQELRGTSQGSKEETTKDTNDTNDTKEAGRRSQR
jgi:hypothetical protein